MIPRPSELAAILAHVDRMCAQKHTANTLFITGEAGIGKTTLLKQLKASHGRDVVWATTECSTPLLGHDVGEMEALEPWAQLMQQLLAHHTEPRRKGEVGELLLNVAKAWVGCVPVVGGIIGSGLETAALLSKAREPDEVTRKGELASQDQMFQQYINFLHKLADEKPLVLVLDDFHWADTSSTNLLFAAARQLAKQRILFIVAYRADDAMSSRGGQGHPLLHVRNELGRYNLFAEIVVGKLVATDIDAMLRARYTSYEDNDDFEAWLADTSGGNPLFITQYLATLEEDGIVDPVTGHFKGRFDSVRVPTSAFSVVDERIRRLDDDARELLRYASVEGATFTVKVLAATSGLPVLKLLQRLRIIAERYGVIRSLGKQRLYAADSTAFQFTNVVLARALYDSLEREETDILHHAIFDVLRAEWLESRGAAGNPAGAAARLAVHASASGDHLFAAQLLLDAATASWRRFAEDETLRLIKSLTALLDEATSGDAADRDRLLAEAHLLRGLVAKFRGRCDDAIADFRAAQQLFHRVGDGARERYAMARECFTLENKHDDAEALARSRATLAAAEHAGDMKTQGAMLNNIGLVLTRQGHTDEALDHQARSLAIRERAGDRVGQAVSLGSIGVALFAAGRHEDALEHHRRALALREDLGDRVGQGFSLSNIGKVLSAIGMAEQALGYHERSFQIRETLGDRVGEAASLEHAAAVLTELGRRDDALARHVKALAILQLLGDRTGELRVRVHAAALQRALGHDGDARAQLEAARTLAAQLGDDKTWRAVTGELGSLALANAAATRARAAADEAVALLEAAHAAEELDRARALVAELAAEAPATAVAVVAPPRPAGTPTSADEMWARRRPRSEARGPAS